MGKGKRRGNKGDNKRDMGKQRGDGIPPPAPLAGAGDQGKQQADEVAMLRAFNAKIVAELVETRARLAERSLVAVDGVVKQHQQDDGDVLLPGDVEEPPLHGATKDAAVQERKDLEKDVAALPVISEVSDAVSAVVDEEEESEEESPEEEEKQEKAAEVPADDDVVAREVHVAATDSEPEEDASLRARLAAAEERAARLEAANAEKVQAGAPRRQGGRGEGSVRESRRTGKATRGDPGKKNKKQAPAARARRTAETEKPVIAAAPVALAPAARHGGKGEGTSEAGPELDASQAHGGGRPKRTVIPNTRYPSDTWVVYGDAARVEPRRNASS